MSRPTFVEGVGVAIISSFVASILFAVLTVLLEGVGVLRLVISVLGFSYIFYLLLRSREKTGRLTVVTLWLIMAVLLWLVNLPLLLFAMAHMGMVWLVRSLYFYSSIISALLDLALNMISLMAAYWAGIHSDSIFLTVWTYFLVQAVFVAIPEKIRKHEKQKVDPGINDTRFQRAYQAAQTAVQKLTSV